MLLASILFAFPLALQGPAAGEPPIVPIGWESFPVFVWRETYAGKPLPEELIEPFGGTLLMREEPSEWLRAKGHAYLIFNAAGRSPLHLDADAAWNERVERWIATHDEELLVREPCLNDPQVRQALFATLESTLRVRDGDWGLGLSLGDEVSLTPNGSPLDLCRCAQCEELWRAHARERGLPERAPLTDEVRLALLEDDTSLLGAWLARRRFDHERVVALLDDLARRARPHGDGPPVGLLGCSGRTPFGGVAIERLAGLDFVECYPTGDARELVATVAGAVERAGTVPAWRPRSLATLFVAGESPAGLAWLVWEHWMRGGDGLVLWKDADLARLTAAQRARLEHAVTAVRHFATRFGFRKPTRAGAVALLHDDDSDALAFLLDALLDGATWPRRNPSHQEEHGTRARKIKSWIRMLEDAGRTVASLPVQQLGADSRSTPDVLVAVDLLVLGADDVLRLERHLARGGRLIVDGRLGWVDRAGVPRGEDALAHLRALAPGRVHAAPALAAGYLAARGNVETRRNSARALRTLLADDGAIAAEPALAGAAERFGWLRAAFGAGQRLQVWLPNCPTRDERAALTEVELRVTVPDGFRLEWLHPADGKVLAAGDAAIFALRPSDEPERR